MGRLKKPRLFFSGFFRVSACFWRNFRASSLFENFFGSWVSGLVFFVLGCLLG